MTGSGPGGAIVRADIERALGAGAPRQPDEKRAVGLDLDAMRAAIAAAMARSKREIPHYYLEHQVDMGGRGMAGPHERERPPDRRLLMGALSSRQSPCRAAVSRFQRLLPGRKIRARGGRPCRHGHRDPRRRVGGPGDP